jgi:hypothetical protein
MGYAPGLSEEECWRRTRGLWHLNVENVLAEQAVLITDGDGFVRAVAAVKGVSPLYGKRRAIVGHPWVGQPSPRRNTAQNAVGYFPDVAVPVAFPLESATSADGLARDVEELVRSQGQGMAAGLSAEHRRLVERRAMALTAATYASEGWDVMDVSAIESFDLLCRNHDRELHVEVKGTTGHGFQVLVTYNEVREALANPDKAVLAVVHGVVLTCEPGALEAIEGVLFRVDPWKPTPENLTPIAYRHILTKT